MGPKRFKRSRSVKSARFDPMATVASNVYYIIIRTVIIRESRDGPTTPMGCWRRSAVSTIPIRGPRVSTRMTLSVSSYTSTSFVIRQCTSTATSTGFADRFTATQFVSITPLITATINIISIQIIIIIII